MVLNFLAKSQWYNFWDFSWVIWRFQMKILLFKGLFQDGSKDLFPLFLKVAAFLFISFFCDDALLLNSIDLDVCEKIVSLEMSFWRSSCRVVQLIYGTPRSSSARLLRAEQEAAARNGAAKQFSNTNGLSLLFAKAAIDTWYYPVLAGNSTLIESAKSVILFFRLSIFHPPTH